MRILDCTLGFIAPHHCLECREEGAICCQKCLEKIKRDSRQPICYSCQSKISSSVGICKDCQMEAALDGIWWFSDYRQDLSKSLIKALKFNNTYAASYVMAKAISSILPPELITSLDYLSAIPTANYRVRQRGWDQAKLITSSTSRIMKIPQKSFLIRVSSFDQIGATKTQRSEASKNFFKPIRSSLFQNKTILLLDDVLTTGATLNSAARTLKSAGAKKVYAVTFARQGVKKS